MLRRREREKETRAKPPRRRMVDWSPTVEILSAILDRLGELTQAVAALGGAKPHKLQRAPVPVTAYDRARDRIREKKHHSLVARVLPGRGQARPQKPGDGGG